MGNMTRRKFIQGTTAIAAGAAVGLTARKGIRKHAPVKIRTVFLSTALVIQGALYADDRRDVFGIRAFDKGKEELRAELRLSSVRKAVASSARKIRCHVTTWDEEGRIREGDMNLVAKDGNLTFRVQERGRSPDLVWMRLTDVRHVL